MKFKRLIAITGISILVILYIATFISAFFTSAATPELFKACLYATIVVPVMFYGYLLIYRVSKNRAEDNKREFEEALAKGAQEPETYETDDIINNTDDNNITDGEE
ncbi:MAG: hypothetical protein E7265_07050 [Lachnospiraceae bacterium]|nr:hypothetical protein [Lachnospiraceae bacterium]